MVKYGHDEDAKQQISLGFAESRIGEAPPVTADNLIEAANILLAMHDFDLAIEILREGWPGGCVAGRGGHRSGKYLSGSGQDQGCPGKSWRRSVPIRLPIRITTICWRRAKSTGSGMRAGML